MLVCQGRDDVTSVNHSWESHKSIPQNTNPSKLLSGDDQTWCWSAKAVTMWRPSITASGADQTVLSSDRCLTECMSGRTWTPKCQIFAFMRVSASLYEILRFEFMVFQVCFDVFDRFLGNISATLNQVRKITYWRDHNIENSSLLYWLQFYKILSFVDRNRRKDFNTVRKLKI